MTRPQQFRIYFDEAFEILSKFKAPLPANDCRTLALILAHHKDSMARITQPSTVTTREVNNTARRALSALTKFQAAWTELCGISNNGELPPYSVEISAETLTFTRAGDQPDVASFFWAHDLNGESLWALHIADCLQQMLEEQRQIQRSTVALTWDQRVDNVLISAAKHCVAAGISISVQENSRFFKIADWLLPANTGTPSRIKKVNNNIS